MLHLVTILFLSCLLVQAGEVSKNALASSTNRIAFKLANRLGGPNQFWSPFGVSLVLAMAYSGAKGETARVMESVLGYAGSKPSIHKAVKYYLQHDNGQLKVANIELISARDHFLPSYQNFLKEGYHAICEEVDFEAKSVEIMGLINDWVRDTTNGNIENFLTEPLEPDTAMVLLNSIYFKGAWQLPFTTFSTTERTFYNNGEEAVLTPMMHTRRNFIYHEEPTYRILELPYSESPYRMMIFLPRDPKGVYDLQKNLTAEIFEHHVATMKAQHKNDIAIAMPKFEMEFSQSMKGPLKSLGLDNMFGPDSDFSGINGKQDLYVSEILQKSKLKVTENGTEAASGTILVYETKSSPFRFFIMDHPFLVFIYDIRNSMVVFEGRIVNLV